MTNSEVVLRVIAQIGDDTNSYKGDMAQFRVWNRQLTTDERAEEYNRKRNIYAP